MLKVGDVVRIIVNRPNRAVLSSGDVVHVCGGNSQGVTVSGGWRISATPGEHAEIVARAEPDREESDSFDRAKAEQLCKTYDLYRKAHDHQTAFELAYGIEIEGLPF